MGDRVAQRGGAAVAGQHPDHVVRAHGALSASSRKRNRSKSVRDGAPSYVAACESSHASVERETLQGARDYGDAGACTRTVFAWLASYDTRRRHSAREKPEQVDLQRHACAGLSESPEVQEVRPPAGPKDPALVTGREFCGARGIGPAW